MRCKWLVGVCVIASGLAGGSAVAAAYPPVAPPPDPVVTAAVPPQVAPPAQAAPDAVPSQAASPAPAAPVRAARTQATLAETGSDPSFVVALAAGVLAAGCGLLLVARRRRQFTI